MHRATRRSISCVFGFPGASLQTSCLSNARQIGSPLMMYVQDYDETYPYIHFHCLGRSSPGGCYVWKNAIRLYLRNLDVLGCPSNPFSRSSPGVPDLDPARPGSNAEGWQEEPEQRMPTSYGMNSCAITWVPAVDKADRPDPPLRAARVERAAVHDPHC